MKLSKFKNENAFMGSGVMDGSFKQARLTQVAPDPTQMFIAMALVSIQSKLNEISETQREILNFMFDKEEAKLAGNLKVLNQTVDDYKYNSDDISYKKHMLSHVGNIRREASQSEELYKKQVFQILLSDKTFHTVGKANDLVNKLRKYLQNYHLAFYIRTYTEFLEIFLIGNFSEENLIHIRDRFIAEKEAYDKQYLECCKWTKNYLESAFGQSFSPILNDIDELYAKAFSHVPGHLDRFFKADASKYVSTDTQIKKLSVYKKSGTAPFIDSINRIKRLQNDPVELYIKDKEVYIVDEKVEGTCLEL